MFTFYLGLLASGFTSSSLAFWLSCSASQIIQYSLNLSCTSVAANFCGLLTIICGSLATSKTIRIHHSLGTSNQKVYYSQNPLIESDVNCYLSNNLSSESYTKDALIGIITFHLLGGRLFSTSPSNLLAPGVFSRHYFSAPADLSEYAGNNLREILKGFGSQTGCHHCGRRRLKVPSESWVADHQPPNAYLLRRNNTIKGKLLKLISTPLGLKWTKQRFYPQCSRCSQDQSKCLRNSQKSKHVLHIYRIRPYHITGGIIYLLKIFDNTNWDHLFQHMKTRFF